MSVPQPAQPTAPPLLQAAPPAPTPQASTVPNQAAPPEQDFDLQASGVAALQQTLQGNSTSNSMNLLSGSIICQVSSKVKQKIWAGEFVELSMLLDKTDKAEQLDETYSIHIDKGGDMPALQLVPHAKKGQTLSLLQWVRAWNRFCAIVTEQTPTLGPVLAHHLETVLNLANKGAAWRTYDEQFRKLVALAEAKWGSAHLELYLKSHLEGQTKERATADSSSVQKDIKDMPKGACYRYHATGTCTSGTECKYQHNCYNCMGRHPYKECKYPIRKPFKVLDRFYKTSTTAHAQPFPAQSFPARPASDKFQNRPTTQRGQKQ